MIRRVQIALAGIFLVVGLLCSAQAQLQNKWIGGHQLLLEPIAAAGGVFSTYVQTDNPAAQAAPGSTTVTFSGVNIGTAASNRVVVLVFSSATNVATNVTVGLTTMTKAIEESSIASGLQIWYGTVASGATANVVLTFAGNPTNCLLVAGAFNSGASVAPSGTPQSAANASATSQSLNQTIPTGGFAIMGTVEQTSVQTPTWTNMTASGGDATNSVVNNSIYTAHSTTAGSPTALSISLTGAANSIHSVSASWGP